MKQHKEDDLLTLQSDILAVDKIKLKEELEKVVGVNVLEIRRARTTTKLVNGNEEHEYLKTEVDLTVTEADKGKIVSKKKVASLQKIVDSHVLMDKEDIKSLLKQSEELNKKIKALLDE